MNMSTKFYCGPSDTYQDISLKAEKELIGEKWKLH